MASSRRSARVRVGFGRRVFPVPVAPVRISDACFDAVPESFWDGVRFLDVGAGGPLDAPYFVPGGSCHSLDIGSELVVMPSLAYR